MHGVLGRLDADLHEQLGRVGGVLAEQRNLRPLNGSERLQDEGGGIFSAGRTPDTDAHPLKIFGTQGGRDRAQPVVAAFAATELEPDPAEVDIQLVVQDDDIAGQHGVELEFIQPRKVTQNSYVERFNRAFRGGILNFIFSLSIFAKILIKDVRIAGITSASQTLKNKNSS